MKQLVPDRIFYLSRQCRLKPPAGVCIQELATMIQKAERDAPKATKHENLAVTKMLVSCLTVNRYSK